MGLSAGQADQARTPDNGQILVAVAFLVTNSRVISRLNFNEFINLFASTIFLWPRTTSVFVDNEIIRFASGPFTLQAHFNSSVEHTQCKAVMVALARHTTQHLTFAKNSRRSSDQILSKCAPMIFSTHTQMPSASSSYNNVFCNADIGPEAANRKREVDESHIYTQSYGIYSIFIFNSFLLFDLFFFFFVFNSLLGFGSFADAPRSVARHFD